MKSGEQEYQEDVAPYLKHLVRLAWETQEAMFDVEQSRKRPDLSTEDVEAQKRNFYSLLERLYFRYRPKMEYTNELDLPKDVKEALKDGEESAVYALSFDQAKQLCRHIRDLMEKLGHTKFESETYAERGIGGKE